tara:strand:+ start:173 stop:376 length:204 start_codon:yes stop_codon:yes gene_type:complete
MQSWAHVNAVQGLSEIQTGALHAGPESLKIRMAIPGIVPIVHRGHISQMLERVSVLLVQRENMERQI